jgi:hypothetical protein
MATFTALNIIDLARSFVDRDGTDDGVTNTRLLTWVNTKYHALRRRIAEVAPDLFRAAVTFSITSGSTWAITATDFAKVLKVELKVGTEWYPVPVAPLLSAEGTAGFRLRGTTIEVFPSADALGDYRLTYITKRSSDIAATGDTLDLPEGADQVLAHEIAALIEARQDRDPGGQLTLAQATWDELRETIVNQYAATPQQIAQVF